MASRRHREYLQNQLFPEPTEPIIPNKEDIDLNQLRENLQQIVEKVPRITPEKTTVPWPVQETGQIMSALMRHLTPELTRVRPTHLPKKMAEKILSAEDYRKNDIGKIGARRFDILQEALRVTMKRPRK